MMNEEVVEDVISSLSSRIRGVSDFLASSGWYFSLDSSWRYFLIAENGMKSGDISRVDQEFCLYFEDRMESIGHAIARAFPQRTRIIDDSIKAHKDGIFTLSVLGFLSQCDGLFKEITGADNFY